MSAAIAKRLRDACPATQDFTHTTQGALMDEAADRIEQLTAERDEAWAYMSAVQGDLYDAIMIGAERDRLREALEGLMAHEPDYSDTLWQDARAALKGESHE